MREISTRPFDPRAWNLVTGVALITACGPGSFAGDTEDTSSSEDSTESTGNTTDSTETGDDPECVTDEDCDDSVCNHNDGTCVECIGDDDCGYAYECINNSCELDYFADDCWDLYDPFECGQYEVCGHYGGPCVHVVDPPLPDCNVDVMGIPTVLDPGAPPIALSFVDVDDDGLDELAVATKTQLLVYEFGIPDPSVTDRPYPSEPVPAMVSAQFDGQPGEDLMLLANPHVHGYFSDGISAFVNPFILQAPVEYEQGLLAGDFDGQDPEDLWVWGRSGARLYVGGMDLEVEVPGPEFEVRGISAFEFLSPYAGFLLGSYPLNFELSLFDLAGNPLTHRYGRFDSIAAVSSPNAGLFVSAGYHAHDWSHIRFRDAHTLAETQVRVHAGNPSLLAADIDGDQWQEVLVVGEAVELILDVFDAACIQTLELGIQPAAIASAVGDHDGDGDDEFAIISAMEKVIIVDVE
jgi:hypothetical protein